MMVIGRCLIVAGMAGLGYEAVSWAASGSWVPTTVEDVYLSLGAYELLESAGMFRAAASWYLDIPIAALLLAYGGGFAGLGWWRRRRWAQAWNARFQS